ncbi:MAG: hypothetical protein R2684_08750 [Pyrinomonadaceae bacterium]
MNRRIFQRFLYGNIFDKAMAFLSLLVFPPVVSLFEQSFQKSFSTPEADITWLALIIVAATIWRWLALYMKANDLRRRGKSVDLGLAWLFHAPSAVLGAAFVTVAIFATAINVLGIEIGETWIAISALTFLILEGTLLYRLSNESSEMKEAEPAKLGTLLFVQGGLVLNVLLWQGFYHFFLNTMFREIAPGIGYLIALLILSAIVFAFFYIGPRAILLAESEDRNKWIYIAAVFILSIAGSLLWKVSSFEF